jgi:type IV pilus assembly protein PilN
LVDAVPDGLYLTKLDQDGRSLVVEGRAKSNERVSEFMRKIEASAWIGRPRLLLIENKDDTATGLSHFRLSFDQLTPEPATTPAQTDGADVPPARIAGNAGQARTAP